jgi:hypothetical protein
MENRSDFLCICCLNIAKRYRKCGAAPAQPWKNIQTGSSSDAPSHKIPVFFRLQYILNFSLIKQMFMLFLSINYNHMQISNLIWRSRQKIAAPEKYFNSICSGCATPTNRAADYESMKILKFRKFKRKEVWVRNQIINLVQMFVQKFCANFHAR